MPGVQVALYRHGYYKGAIDGISGPMTKAAIRKFQKDKGLTPDGVVGQRTRAAFGTFGGGLFGSRMLKRGHGRLRRLGAAVPARQARLPDEVAEQQLRRWDRAPRAQVPAANAAARGRDRRPAHPRCAPDRERLASAATPSASRRHARGPSSRRPAWRDADRHCRPGRHDGRSSGAAERARPAAVPARGHAPVAPERASVRDARRSRNGRRLAEPLGRVLRRQLRPRSRARLAGIGLPEPRPLRHRRERRHAGHPRDVVLRGAVPDRRPSAEDRGRQRQGRRRLPASPPAGVPTATCALRVGAYYRGPAGVRKHGLGRETRHFVANVLALRGRV